MLLPTHGLHAQQHSFELADLAKLTGLSDPQFLPDGKQIAYWYPRQGKYTNISKVWVTPTDGGEGHNLTLALDRDVAGAAVTD